MRTAVDTTLDREITVKILPPTLGGDPEQLASLDHPDVAAVHCLHESGSTGSGQAGLRFAAMELVPGEDLAERLGRRAIPVAESLDGSTWDHTIAVEGVLHLRNVEEMSACRLTAGG